MPAAGKMCAHMIVFYPGRQGPEPVFLRDELERNTGPDAGGEHRETGAAGVSVHLLTEMIANDIDIGWKLDFHRVQLDCRINAEGEII